MMGSPAGELCQGGDETEHQVTLSHAFLIAETEVTRNKFSTLMGYSIGATTLCTSNCPAQTVTWHEAAAFCNAQSTKAGHATCYVDKGSGATCTEISPCTAPEVCANGKCVNYEPAKAYSGSQIYDCPGYRLPTEAEWEFAYRAGTTTALYNGAISSCTGADTNADAIAWYDQNSSLDIQSVGGKLANAYGLLDMAGNVAEWCHDRYQASLAKATDPFGAATGTERVVRGGDADAPAGTLRAAARAKADPATRHKRRGFRCVRTN
jgi:formylglycine-generating enzyme required for sulfatase activity